MISAEEYLAAPKPAAAHHHWRVAIIDLAGHFALATPIGDEIVLFNTTGINKLLIYKPIYNSIM